jgi:pilus assembly protein CpaC
MQHGRRPVSNPKNEWGNRRCPAADQKNLTDLQNCRTLIPQTFQVRTVILIGVVMMPYSKPFAFSVALALSTPALAQQSSLAEPYTVSRATDVIEVEVSAAVTITSATEFTELSMANPEIADLTSLSETVIYVVDKQLGKTTMTVIRGGASLSISHHSILVYRDIAPLQGFLAQAAEQVTLTRDGVMVTATGCVSESSARAAAEDVLAQMKDWGYVTLSDIGECSL